MKKITLYIYVLGLLAIGNAHAETNINISTCITQIEKVALGDNRILSVGTCNTYWDTNDCDLHYSAPTATFTIHTSETVLLILRDSCTGAIISQERTTNENFESKTFSNGTCYGHIEYHAAELAQVGNKCEAERSAYIPKITQQ